MPSPSGAISSSLYRSTIDYWITGPTSFDGDVTVAYGVKALTVMIIRLAYHLDRPRHHRHPYHPHHHQLHINM